MVATAAPSLPATRPLPLRARPDLCAQPVEYGGCRYWTVKDPLSLRYFQFRDEEYRLLQMLDGRATLQSLKTEFEREFAPRRLSDERLQHFLAHLHREGLLVADVPGQGRDLLRRDRQVRRRTRLAAASNVLAVRFRGVDPEPFLGWLYPKCRWLFSRAAVVAGLLLGVAALLLVVVQFDALLARLPDFHAFFSLRNAVWLAFAVAIVKVLHELGHGLTCRHFGGECHELGLMFLVFTPCLYCNVSDAWMLPGKWQRIAIGAAGMYVELVLAAFCTFLWWFSEPGLFHYLCLNIMFVCSVSTLLFNGNPLLRYDGYYILSDLLEVPNLQPQSAAVVRRRLGRWFLGAETVSERSLPDRLRGTLAAYWTASTLYRWFVLFAIFWFLHTVLEPHGLAVVAQVLAVMALSGLVFVPLWRFIRFLSDPVRSRQVNWNRFRVRGLLTAGLLAAALLVPLPYRITAPAAIELLDARRVYVPVAGILAESIREGDRVQPGETLARLENLELRRDVARLQGRVALQRQHLQSLERRGIGDPQVRGQLPAAREILAELEERLRQRLGDQQRLTLTAPRGGTVLAHRGDSRTPPGAVRGWEGTPLDERNLGCRLETGTLFCLVGDPDRTEAVLIIDQSHADFVRTGQRVRIRLDQLAGETLWGTVGEIAEIDLKTAPRPLAAHEDLPTRLDERGLLRPLSASYQARIALDEHQHRLVVGATGRAKIHADPQSLARRLVRFASRTFRLEL